MQLPLLIYAALLATGFVRISKKEVAYSVIVTHSDTMHGVIIENFGKKGNGVLDNSGKNGYNDSLGNNFAYVIFWTRIANETTSPLNLFMNFPSDSFPLPQSKTGFVKLFLPPDKMSREKEPLYDYGLTGIKSFLDKNFHKPTSLKKTIKPGEEFLFYVLAVSQGYDGVSTAGLRLKDHDLSYHITMLDSVVPCGIIRF